MTSVFEPYRELFEAEGVEDRDEIFEAVQFVLDNEDPRGTLPALGAVLSWADEVEEDLVTKGRIEGMSWAEIGNALGRSKQAVWARHHNCCG